MTIQEKLNSPAMYLITGAIILFVAGLCVVFMIRAYKAGQAIGMDKKQLKKTITASATFSVLPSTAILLGVIALSGTLGIPLPWLRLSVVGALHYEASVADIAARGAGMNGLNAAELTLEAFTSIAFVMTVGIIWGMALMLTLGKTYCNRITRSNNDRHVRGPHLGLPGQLYRPDGSGRGRRPGLHREHPAPGHRRLFRPGHGRDELPGGEEKAGLGGELLHCRQYAYRHDGGRPLRHGRQRVKGGRKP